VRPVEEALATLSGIEEIRATAGSDQAQFTVLFDWDRDAETAAFEVRTKIDSIRSQLPAAADRVLMFAFSASDEPVIVIRIASDQDLTDQYDTLEKYLKRPIERLDGVARVELEGVQPRELRVLVDPDRIAAYGIDVQALRTLLERSNFSVSAGEITETASVSRCGRSAVPHDLRRARPDRPRQRPPERHRAGGAGRAGLPIGRHIDGRPAVGIDVYKSTQANVVDVADRVLAAVDEARNARSCRASRSSWSATRPTASVSRCANCATRALIGAGLSFFMLLLFLRHCRRR